VLALEAFDQAAMSAKRKDVTGLAETVPNMASAHRLAVDRDMTRVPPLKAADRLLPRGGIGERLLCRPQSLVD
jgi:hypothetical protein